MSESPPTYEQLTAEVQELRQKVTALEAAEREHRQTEQAQHEAMLAATRQLEQQLKENTMLLQISQTLASSLELDTTLQQIVDAAAALIETADRAVIHLLDENQTYLRSVAVAGQDNRPASKGLNFNAGEIPRVRQKTSG